jgi:hypothetical protein
MWKEHVVRGREPGQELELLEDEARDVVPQYGKLILAEAGNVLSHYLIGTGGGDVQEAKDIQHGGFSRTRGSHDGYKFPGVDGDRYPLTALTSLVPIMYFFVISLSSIRWVIDFFSLEAGA